VREQRRSCADSNLVLPEIGVESSLAELYEGVDFGE